MNRIKPALAFAVALLSATVGHAADKTYLVNRAFDYGSVTGTIVTTGDFGTLDAQHGISSWELQLVSDGYSFNLTPLNSYLFGSGLVTATPLELTYDFDSGNYFGFFHSGADKARWCLQSSYGQCTFSGVRGELVAVTQGNLVEQFQDLAGTQTIAVAGVPEPATYALWLAGLGLLGLAAKRRADA